MKKVKFIMFLIALILFEIISYAIGAAFQLISDYTSTGVAIDQVPFSEEYMIYLLNVPGTFSKLITTPNPIYVLCAIGSVILAFMMIRGAKESGYQIQPQYAVHGGSRWATHDEITRKNQIEHCKQKEILDYLLASMEGEGNEK